MRSGRAAGAADPLSIVAAQSLGNESHPAVNADELIDSGLATFPTWRRD
jgi:hypothetical protein